MPYKIFLVELYISELDMYPKRFKTILGHSPGNIHKINESHGER